MPREGAGPVDVAVVLPHVQGTDGTDVPGELDGKLALDTAGVT